MDEKTATDMAKLVQGYAYAYQVLGSLYFNKKEEEKIEDLILKFDTIIYRDSYDLIWQSLTMAERELVVDILNTESGKVMDIKKKMKKPDNFASLRDRLIKKHLVETKGYGYIRINLPRFKNYVLTWVEE